MDIFFLIFLLSVIFALLIFFCWVGIKVLNFLFGFLFSSTLPPRYCKACGSELNPTSMQCFNCGKNFLPAVSTELHELRIALAQLEKLVDRDEVSKEASAAVLIALQNRLAKITPVPIPPSKPVEASSIQQLISVIDNDSVPPALPMQSTESKTQLEDERPVLPFPKNPEAPIIVKPQRTLAGVLSLFLESRNIVLGELVGGLLIVGGSVALVGTLWNSLEQIPYFPFLMLAAITLLLFFAGQYTLHHWKLHPPAGACWSSVFCSQCFLFWCWQI